MNRSMRYKTYIKINSLSAGMNTWYNYCSDNRKFDNNDQEATIRITKDLKINMVIKTTINSITSIPSSSNVTTRCKTIKAKYTRRAFDECRVWLIFLR